MKVGIMGGTFDPIHNGHLMLGSRAYDDFGLDEVWFMPNGNPPHKSQRTSADDRIAMVNLAIQPDSKFRLCTYETDKTSKSYSYETLENLKILYPEHNFYFIIGADSLFSIESWKEPSRVLAACTILAACRDDKEPEDVQEQIQYLEGKYAAKIELLRTPHMDISSSDLRRMAAFEMDMESVVPKAVADYIQSHELYKDVSVS